MWHYLGIIRDCVALPWHRGAAAAGLFPGLAGSPAGPGGPPPWWPPSASSPVPPCPCACPAPLSRPSRTSSPWSPSPAGPPHTSCSAEERERGQKTLLPVVGCKPKTTIDGNDIP